MERVSILFYNDLMSLLSMSTLKTLSKIRVPRGNWNIPLTSHLHKRKHYSLTLCDEFYVRIAVSHIDVGGYLKLCRENEKNETKYYTRRHGRDQKYVFAVLTQQVLGSEKWTEIDLDSKTYRGKRLRSMNVAKNMVEKNDDYVLKSN
ncbi:hypothetical protein L596_011876 [Steinernema carpocapsae]|uniref:Uncharacterized protein n=1 Tax=Steinernema carpocapsae TaxID=34508 RepID=A0A4U5NVL5_STECR|nr:hypothetical protein L596_011876 [Steinernema carpocapsae]